MKKMNPTAELLLKTAERLFALEGIDSVSTRQIARQAGQKNHSALQYHFGSRERLIDAILDFRMQPLNERRELKLAELKGEGRMADTRALVELFVRPFAEELLQPPEESYYVSLIAQLYSLHQGERVYGDSRNHSSAMQEVSRYLIDCLQPMPDELVLERLHLFGMQMVQAVAGWDYQRREGGLALTPRALELRIVNLMDYVVGGLTAPVSVVMPSR